MALLSICSDIGVDSSPSWRGRGRARPWQRYLRDLIAGLADFPLAHAVAAGAFGEIHMDVVLMIAV
jgi:hypothetical protein